MNIRPLGKKILFQVFEEPAEELRGGIVVRNTASRGAYRKAVVRRLPSAYRGGLSEGDEVMLKPWCGTEITVGRDERLVFALEDEVMCVVDQ